ncbi:MAG: ATP-binding protein [Planctomycetes bacterium]|nr:ATP-binding protein [Planctomycetota bacterium]
MSPERPLRRVVLTGGPAAGKTAIADVLRRQLADEVTVVPESATILFQGGFPRPTSTEGRRLVQKAVFTVQRELEAIYGLTHPNVPQVLDRGSLDGGAYWPGGLSRFLGAMGTTLESEYRRYDAVIFLESTAYDKDGYPSDNPVRIESPAAARKIDARLREIWQGHPRFTLIERQARFYEKVAAVLIALERALSLDSGVAS